MLYLATNRASEVLCNFLLCIYSLASPKSAVNELKISWEITWGLRGQLFTRTLISLCGFYLSTWHIALYTSFFWSSTALYVLPYLGRKRTYIWIWCSSLFPRQSTELHVGIRGKRKPFQWSLLKWVISSIHCRQVQNFRVFERFNTILVAGVVGGTISNFFSFSRAFLLTLPKATNKLKMWASSPID